MASLQERRNKDGKLISYSIRVHRGRDLNGKQLKPYTATFDVLPTWKEDTARKKAEAFASVFEKECKDGIRTDSRQRFDVYCDYVIDLKERNGVKHSTICRYKDLTKRIYPAIGHFKITDLRPQHLNCFYENLSEAGISNKGFKAIAKSSLAEIIKKRKLSKVQLAELSGLSCTTITAACKGGNVSKKSALAISKALDKNINDIFIVDEDKGKLSNKTIIEYHRLIHTVLAQAEKEMLVPYNAASKATPPKAETKEVNYFQPEQITAIRNALENEPPKWKMLVHLFLITGARRGEILGLKWDKVDFEKNRIYICNSILYSAERGIYEDTPKTEKSKRYIALPCETMAELKEYKRIQWDELFKCGIRQKNDGFIFSRYDGEPLHPDSVTNYLTKFSEKYNLPHINAHAFRHTMASLLYFNGVDSVSISGRLGHAQVSTTANIYAHVIEKADQRNADILSEVFLKKA